jgi:hypothetical protein
VVGWFGDRRRLDDIAARGGSERDTEGCRGSREQPRNQRTAGDRDREEKRCEQALLPTHVAPSSADNFR